MRTCLPIWLAAAFIVLLPPGVALAQTTVTFESPAPAGVPDSNLNGSFGGLAFGSGQWRWSGPFGSSATNSIYFASSSGTSRALSFLSGSGVLNRIIVYTVTDGTLTLADGANAAVTRTVTRGSLLAIDTGWTRVASGVTVSFSAGWALGIDAISYSAAATPPPVTDTTPPMVSISAPAPNATVSGVVGVSASAFDQNGVAGVQFAVDGVNVGPEDSVSPYAYAWNTAGITNGSHSLTAVARDVAGNRTTASPVAVNVSNPAVSPAGYALRFFGTGSNDIDRVKIRIDDPATTLPGPPADIGATDFTIEFWINTTEPGPATSCYGYDWIYGRTIFDRDRYNQNRAYGISMTGGRIAFGVAGPASGRTTICSSGGVADGRWHHVAVQRRVGDGRMWIHIDGVLQAEADGPDGDISYPDNGVPGPYCGVRRDTPCTLSDPFIVIGAEKHDDGSEFPSYAGLFDELRLSRVLRYSGTGWKRPSMPFSPDAGTVGLYHFDEGQGTVVGDGSGAAGGPSPGNRRVGGNNNGPVWVATTPF